MEKLTQRILLLIQDDMVEIIKMCISYVFRRSICDIPTNSLNKTFATLRNEIKTDDYMNSMNMSAAFYTRRRKRFTVEAEKFDTCGGRIGQCRRRRFIGA